MNDLYYSIFFLNIVVYLKKKKLHAKMKLTSSTPIPAQKEKKMRKEVNAFLTLR